MASETRSTLRSGDGVNPIIIIGRIIKQVIVQPRSSFVSLSMLLSYAILLDLSISIIF
jgi:hypothetical protein